VHTISDVTPGDVFTTNIIIHGYSDLSPVPICFDVMLVIDMSSSMNSNDPDGIRFDAAAEFLRSCDEVNLQDGAIHAGIVGFRKNGRMYQVLTDDFSVFFDNDGVISKMSDENLGAKSSIRNGLELAQQHLLANGNNNIRAIILLTDGQAEPDADGQSVYIYSELVEEAETESIRYYTVGLGSNPWIDLGTMASLTGGFYEPDATGDEIPGIFQDVFDDISQQIFAEQVTLHLYRDNHVADFVLGSLELSDEAVFPDEWEIDAFADPEGSGYLRVDFGPMEEDVARTLSFELEEQ
jgi:hypothetical protein